MIYIDSSALTKLVLDEAETNVLREYTRTRVMTSSALARTEVHRAVVRVDPQRFTRASDLLLRVKLFGIGDAILESAGRLAPPSLRSLDAIHLASALVLGDELEAFVAYDERLLAAAAGLGMPVTSPT